MKYIEPSLSYARLHSPNTIFEVEHGLDAAYPAVFVWDHSTKLLVPPVSVESLDSNTVLITMPYSVIPFVRIIK